MAQCKRRSNHPALERSGGLAAAEDLASVALVCSGRSGKLASRYRLSPTGVRHKLALRTESGRDIWLFGGGSLFASLLAADLVDDIELAVMPVLLGGGVPLVSPGAPRSRLTLTRSSTSPSGIVNLHYEVQHAAG